MEKSELSAIKLEADKEVSKIYENHCLIGKILLLRPVDQTLVKNFTQEEWKCKRGLTVSTISRNMFMFIFQDKEDLASVLKNRPWTIMGGLLMLSVCTSGEVPNELNFSYSAFWVQAHGLPLDYLTNQNGSKIGELLGTFVYTDWEICCGKFSCRKFLRLKVVLDVRKPILTGFWLKRNGLPDVWIDFKYEKLGVFCYKCGLIGNNYRTCKFPSGNAKFGPWLRADLRECDYGGDGNLICGARSTVVGKRVDQDVCTTLLAVPKAKATLDKFSNLDDVAFEHTFARKDSDEQTQDEAGDSIHRSYFSDSKLWQRLIFNSIDSTIMLVNCVVVFSQDEVRG
ncbi:hypothetical protein DH2020_001329 [Rehmannia glutinosa]|uniref:DUF4283 domain-containing protein n=1 Tax=Rehmannia glutinosa TaxID=99300 RepID=A0ABR0XZR2_REHGL